MRKEALELLSALAPHDESKRRPKHRPLIVRLAASIDFQGPDACWPWRGSRTAAGYGQIGFNHKKLYVHRVVYELLVGPIPEGLTIDHLCRNRACCNPAHLEPVSNRTNILRGESRPAIHARKTHCVNGHEFTHENTYRNPSKPSSNRVCRECKRLTNAARDKNRTRTRRSK